MEDYRIRKMLDYLKELYPNFSLTDQAIKLWMREMANVDRAICRQAVRECYAEDSSRITLSKLRAKLQQLGGYRQNLGPQTRQQMEAALAAKGLKIVPQGTGWDEKQRVYRKMPQGHDTKPTIEFVMDILGPRYVTQRLEGLVGKAGTVKMIDILKIPGFKANYAALLSELHEMAVSKSQSGRGDAEFRKLWGQGKVFFDGDDSEGPL